MKIKSDMGKKIGVIVGIIAILGALYGVINWRGWTMILGYIFIFIIIGCLIAIFYEGYKSWKFYKGI